MSLASTARTWRGLWIWNPRAKKQLSPTDSLLPVDSDDNSYLYLRKEFILHDAVKLARILCTSSDEYCFYLNGEFIGRGPSPCDDEWKYYDSYDVTSRLRVGSNVFAFICYHYGTPSKNSYYPKAARKAGFLFDSEIVSKKGRRLLLSSDESWRVYRADCWLQNTPRISIVDGYQEVYDANREIEGWLQSGFDDTSWKVPSVVGGALVAPWLNLIPRDIPFLRCVTIFPSAIVSYEENGGRFGGRSLFLSRDSAMLTVDASIPGSLPTITFDFGKEVVGYLKIEFAKISRGIVTLSYGEGLETRDVDRLVTRPGMSSWSPYRRCAFRYVKISFRGFSEPLKLKSLSLDSSAYPTVEAGEFECSDKSLNEIWRVARYTVSLCMQNHFEDCVWREKTLWHNDMEIQALVSYIVFGDYALAAKCFRQMARIQRPDGAIPAFGPKRCDLVIPDYCAHYVIGLQDYYRYSGDRSVLEECFPSIVKLIGWFEAKRDNTGLLNWGNRKIGDRGTWCFIDWADIDRRGEVAALQFLYYKALKSAECIGRVLGEVALAEEWSAKATSIKELAQKLLWSEDRSLYVDCRVGKRQSTKASWSTNVFAMYAALVPSDEVPKLIETLSRDGKTSTIRTPVLNCHLAEMLFDAGEGGKAIDLVRHYWGGMLARGATTFWEEFDPTGSCSTTPVTGLNFDPSSSQSHCHGWSAGPAHLLPRKILGVEPLDNGFRNIVVKPCLSGLSWAKGRVPTPRGDITIHWELLTGGGFNFQIVIPKGIEATIQFPLPEMESPVFRFQGEVFVPTEGGNKVGKLGKVNMSRSDKAVKFMPSISGKLEFNVNPS